MEPTRNPLSENIRARFVQGLNKRLAAAIGQAAAFGDADTDDLFSGISRGVDRRPRFVESHMAPQ